MFQERLKSLITQHMSDMVSQKFGPATSNIAETLLNQIAHNALTPEGQKSLSEALDQHGEDRVDRVDRVESDKILGHILGSARESTELQIAEKYGLKNTEVKAIFEKLAPVVLGALGAEKKSGIDMSALLKNISHTGNSQGLSNTLRDMFDTNKDGSILDDAAKMLLDKNKDGSIIDDLTNIAKKFFTQK